MSRRILIDAERNEAVSVPVAPEVQAAIERATQHAHDELVRELEPFGLGPIDIVIPEFEQVIYEDEVPVFAAVMRAQGQADKEWL